MRTLIVPDVHGRATWKLWVNTTNHDRVVFLGDYFDSFDMTTKEQVDNFLDIVEYKKTSGKEVIMLTGNHDQHYFPNVGDLGVSGYQRIGRYLIENVIAANVDHFQMAYKFDQFLCTHAGVGETFMYNCFGVGGWKIENLVEDLNTLWKEKPMSFEFSGFNPYGDDMGQTPTWIRPTSLEKDSKLLAKAGIVQIV